MFIGVPREIKDNEKRVSVTPSGVGELVNLGNKVYIENNAGLGSGFTNKSYIKVGATILDDKEQLFNQSEMIVKVKEPQPDEIQLLQENGIVTVSDFVDNKEKVLEIKGFGEKTYEKLLDSLKESELDG